MITFHQQIINANMLLKIVNEIRQELEANKDKPEICVVLKRLGRKTLSQFERSAPILERLIQLRSKTDLPTWVTESLKLFNE